ncbi:MAG: glycoside hydrolase [Flavobacteriaceae bacterium]|nr:glycoside hydrolase [Flavobacteriaceae bacterium]
MKALNFFSILFFFTFFSWSQQSKINGISFVASRDTINQKHINPVVNINANYAAIMPFAFLRSTKDSIIKYNSNRQWFGESRRGVKQYVQSLKKNNIKIMLKPQVWIWRGEYTGFIKMNTEAGWKELEKTYSKFILDFASLANDLQVELFCLGTELEQFVAQRPQFWFTLIKKIKTIYKGKLTYAANWDEFKRIPFWKELDYIGVDAYFPVSENKTPSIADCKLGWAKHKPVIKDLSKAHNRPILFTEFGYRSVDFTAKEPWRSDRELNVVNLQAQVNATKALFEEFWKEDWFAGGFIWKWYHNYESSGGKDNNRFTPQNKPTEALIRRQFGAGI